MKTFIQNSWRSASNLSYVFLPVVLAQAPEGPKDARGKIDIGGGAISDVLAALTIGQIISTIIRVLLIAAAVVFFLWLVLGGIRWIMSGGDKARVETARDQVTHALIGLVIVFSAFAIARLIDVLFGVNLFELQIQRPAGP